MLSGYELYMSWTCCLDWLILFVVGWVERLCGMLGLDITGECGISQGYLLAVWNR